MIDNKLRIAEQAYYDVFQTMRLSVGKLVGQTIILPFGLLSGFWVYAKLTNSLIFASIFSILSVATWTKLTRRELKRTISILKLETPRDQHIKYYRIAVILLVIWNIGAAFAFIVTKQYLPEYGVLINKIILAVILFDITYLYNSYQNYVTARASKQTSDQIKEIIAEIDPSANEWISRILGLPIDLKFLKIRRKWIVFLFLISGLGFSVFIMSVYMLPITLIISIIYSDPIVLLNPLFQLVPEYISTTKYAFPFTLILAISSITISLISRMWARRLLITSISESSKSDNRSPILFLRSFADDSVHLPNPTLKFYGQLLNLFQSKKSLDVILLEQCTCMGPVLALGNPNNSNVPYGAQRSFLDNKDWQNEVI